MVATRKVTEIKANQVETGRRTTVHQVHEVGMVILDKGYPVLQAGGFQFFRSGPEGCILDIDGIDTPGGTHLSGEEQGIMTISRGCVQGPGTRWEVGFPCLLS